MKRIKLTQGKFAKVDNSDFDKLNAFNWFLQIHPENMYAKRTGIVNGKRTSIYMHRVIMNTSSSMVVDHINHNGLDCRKINMRNCTQSQNLSNKKSLKNSSSKYLGVSFYNANRMWSSELTHKYKKYKIGFFNSEKAAAKAYDKLAIQLHGEYANLNFK